jgi:hypothetical protein
MMKALFTRWIVRLPALLRGLGPYAAIELLMPGGTVIALLIWLYRQRANVGARILTADVLDREYSTDSEFRVLMKQGKRRLSCES